MPRPLKRKDLVTRRAREMGGLGVGAPQPPEATVVNICSLWAYRFCVSWLRPPEATGAVGFLTCVHTLYRGVWGAEPPSRRRPR